MFQPYFRVEGLRERAFAVCGTKASHHKLQTLQRAERRASRALPWPVVMVERHVVCGAFVPLEAGMAFFSATTYHELRWSRI